MRNFFVLCLILFSTATAKAADAQRPIFCENAADIHGKLVELQRWVDTVLLASEVNAADAISFDQVNGTTTVNAETVFPKLEVWTNAKPPLERMLREEGVVIEKSALETFGKQIARESATVARYHRELLWALGSLYDSMEQKRFAEALLVKTNLVKAANKRKQLIEPYQFFLARALGEGYVEGRWGDTPGISPFLPPVGMTLNDLAGRQFLAAVTIDRDLDRRDQARMKRDLEGKGYVVYEQAVGATEITEYVFFISGYLHQPQNELFDFTGAAPLPAYYFEGEANKFKARVSKAMGYHMLRYFVK